MKIDKYTKIVLTVIAINLTVLTVKQLDLIPSVYAGEPAKEMGTKQQQNYGLVPVNEDGSINVSMNEEVDVNIMGVYTNQELNVNLERIGGDNLLYAEPLHVKIKD